ncbi:MAG: glycoside hydrolase family 3 N-terminal domain-containing protein, partial [Ferruginibacter sp.]
MFKCSVSRFLPLMFFFVLGIQIHPFAQKKNPAREKRIDRIIQSMTLEEKVGQMSQVTLDVLGKRTDGGFVFDTAKLREVIRVYKVGSILNTADNTALSVSDWRSLVAIIQQEAAQNRLNIPVIYGFDAIHGANYVAGATLYPQQIGLAATWNPALVQQAARMSAYESRASSVIWNFSPVLDLGINPLWPRQWETFGEDPYLVSKMGAATVKGYQEPLGSPTTVIACLKHFLAYSDPKSGKDRTNVQLSEQDLREYHLPAFRESLTAGARTVMLNSGLINGVPTHMNKRIITDLLKNELGFTGFTVTDWKDIDNLYSRDKVAVSEKEAVLFAINAGVDMAMIPYDYKPYAQYLTELVNERKVSMIRIDDAVRRILRVKMEAGLFDPTPSQYDAFGAASNEALARSVVAESITVLKNIQQVLPLQPGKSILVTGPNANSMRTLNGGWTYSWQGEKTASFAGQYNTIFKAVQNKFGKNNVRFEPGVVYNMNGKYFQDSIV